MSKYKKQIFGTQFKSCKSITKKLASTNGYNFSICYMELCRQAKIKPLPLICVSLPHNLEFTPDRVKMDEWGPILTALSLDKVLKSIKIHSRFHQNRKPMEEITSENKAKNERKIPLVLTRYILERLSHSLAQCARNSSSLICLELEGIPLTLDCVAALCVGISGNNSLQHLSLCKSHIGDSGCDLICQTIITTRNIKTLNLSHCNLSSKCGSALASALSRQKLSLYHDTWKQSLRYRQPDFEAMPGLRRLTLNGNPQLGNSAANKIIEAVKDSLWMKALDLQNCGLTNGIANEILELIHKNASLIIVDVRANLNLDHRIVEEIMRQLDKNNETSSANSDYKWIGVPTKRVKSAVLIRRPEKTYLTEQVNSNKTSRAIQQPAQAKPSQRALSAENPPTIKIKQVDRKCSTVETSTQEDMKPTLHIDLQAQMLAKSDAESLAETQKFTQSIQDDLSESRLNEQSASSIMNTDRTVLMKKIDNLDVLLHEERLRRKTAEEKLHLMKRSIMELENALSQKEQEMRGYVLVNQDSLNEICTLFDQLLEVLNNMMKCEEPPVEQFNHEYDVENIRNRMTTIIRRTKSDGIRRKTKNILKAPKKCVKSESSFRSLGSPTINIPVSFDRNIGDNPNMLASSIANTLRESERKKLVTPVEISRAIFSKLINSNSAQDHHDYS